MSARRKPGSHLEGFWEFPGGKVEPGENPEECLARELSEEFGIDAQIGLYVGESIFSYGTKTIQLLAFIITEFTGDLQLIDHDAIQWTLPEELDEIKWAPADIPLVAQYRAIRSTKNYYNAHADSYAAESIDFDVSHLYSPFTNRLPAHGHILDVGCGSGRDSEYFIKKGYRVTAIDSSSAIASEAEKRINQPVETKSFTDVREKNIYDGIWANASLLHSPKGQIHEVLRLLIGALKNEGVFFMSFKHGESEETDDRGRFFNNYTKETLSNLLNNFPEIETLRLWENSSILRGKAQTWVNAMVSKKAVRS